MAGHRRRTVVLGEESEPLSSRQAWLITWSVLFGAFCVSFTITILAVGRPAIAKDLGADVNTLVWLISGPTIATALVSASAGKLGDLRGHRTLYLVGISGALVFCVLSALAWNETSLIVFRVLGALVGAATAPSSMAVINLVHPRQRRSAALGYWSLVVAGGPVVGLIVGGPLVDAVGWRAIFWLQAPLFALAVVAAAVLLPQTPRRHDVRFDVAGQLTLIAALGGVLFAVDRGRPWGWGHPAVLGSLATGAVMFVVFVWVERRAVDPLIPLHYFGRRGFSASMGVQLFANFGYMGGFILAPKLLDEVRGLSAGAISLLMAPRPLVFAIVGPVAGYLAPRLGTRRLAITGAGCVTVSLALMGLLSHNPVSWQVVGAIALSGLGMGAAQPALGASVANAVEDRDLGVAAAGQQLVGQLGTTLGMNLLDTIQVQRLAAVGLTASFAQTYAVGASVAGAGVVAALWLRSREAERRWARQHHPLEADAAAAHRVTDSLTAGH